MAEQTSLARGKYLWKIEGLSVLTRTKYHSESFSTNGCSWRIVFYPRGNKIDNFCSVYLEVAESYRLSAGWIIEARVSLEILNQKQIRNSTTRVTPRHVFSSEEKQWGLKDFKNLVDLHDHSKGFVVENTVFIKAEVVVDKTNVLVASEINTYFTNLEGFFSSMEESEASGSAASNTTTTPCPRLVKEAEQTLRQCLEQMFSLDMINKVREALLVLTRAGKGTGLTFDQQSSVGSLLENYSDFVSGFTGVEIDRSRYEVQNLVKERMLNTMKKNYETHSDYNKMFNELSGVEKQLMEKLEQVKVKKKRLVSDWEKLMLESKKVKSRYKEHEKEVSEAETRMISAEERKAASEATWSQLKGLFASN